MSAYVVLSTYQARDKEVLVPKIAGGMLKHGTGQTLVEANTVYRVGKLIVHLEDFQWLGSSLLDLALVIRAHQAVTPQSAGSMSRDELLCQAEKQETSRMLIIHASAS